MPLVCGTKTVVSISSLTQNGFNLLKCDFFMSISVKSFCLDLLQEKSNIFTKSGIEQFVRPVNTSISLS